MSHSMTLGIDLGSESIGWALVRDASQSQPPEIVATGVAIFNSGRNEKGESLAQDRRVKRGQRRRRARYLWRRDRMMRALIRHGLMPQERDSRKKLERDLDPYECRAKAAQKKVTTHELGRALFHINQRRGFLSNRKSEKKADRNAYKNGLEALKAALGNQTLGQYLWEQHNVTQDIHKKPGIRFRSVQNGAKTEYPLYPTRAMYQAEFDKIREIQDNAQGLQPEQWEELSHIIFDQRPLKEQPVGICSLYYGQDMTDPDTGEITKAPVEERSPQALPSAQMFRIVQDINNMAVRGDDRKMRPLSNDEREKLWILFNTQKKIEFKAIRRKLDWPEGADINLENERRNYLKGNETACILAKYFGKDFYKKPMNEQDDIVQFILDCENADDLFNEAVTAWLLPEDKARKMVLEDDLGIEDFPAGYGRFSARAYRNMIPLMRNEQLRYDEATAKLGVHHSDRGADGNASSLPYYADALPLSVTTPKYGAPEEIQKGKIANPTVHIALRQLQKVVNTLIKRYGKPDRIVIETARDLKLSKDEKDQLNREHKKNLDKNEEIKKELESLGEWNGDKGEKILKWKLWEELSKDINDRKCPYTLRQMSKDKLLSHEVEIEHILPRSRTLDDSRANLTVALKSANAMKKNDSPYEAFSHREPHGWDGKNQDVYSYDKILSYAQGLPKNKRWRFEADAMERFKDENEWQSRFLNDTRYTTKIAKKYLQVVCPNVDASAGKLTAKIRKCWGLNEVLGHNKKNRDDHRQHAIDAIVLTQITPALIKAAADANKNVALEEMEIPLPEQWPTLWEDTRKAVHEITIYHRPDHGADGQINEDSAYGIVYNEEAGIDRRTVAEKKRSESDGKIFNLVKRKDIASLSCKELGQIRDEQLRERVIKAVTVDGLIPEEAKILKQKLVEFARATGIRRVRILKIDNPIKLIRHPKETGAHIKGMVPGDIHHIAVWRMPDGQIKVIGVSMFDAKSNADKPEAFKPHPAAKLLMRLHKRDVVRLVHNGEEKTAKIISLSPENGNMRLAEHFEAGNFDKREADEERQIRFKISFSKIFETNLRKIHIDPTGKVYDPGPYIKRPEAA